MLQSSLMLMGNASQHYPLMRRKDIHHHLNPQLKKLMNYSDFKEAQPYLFGQDFRTKVKEYLYAGFINFMEGGLSVASQGNLGIQAATPASLTGPRRWP